MSEKQVEEEENGDQDPSQQTLLSQGRDEGQSGPPGPPGPQPTSVVAPKRAPPRRIDHTYHDYSHFPLYELLIRKKAPTNFPSKLHQILSTPAFSHIISWMPHGRAWKVHNKDLLVREVISTYFVQSKYESFTRQLNGWSFKRLHQSGNDYSAYYHECFLRGYPQLTVLMSRPTQNQGKLLPHVEGEPNFYEIDMQYPLPPLSAPDSGYYDYNLVTSVADHGALPGPPPGPPPESSVGYHGIGHYSSYPNINYLPPPSHYGHYGDTHAHVAPAYAPQPDHPPYAHPPTHHTYQAHGHYPHYPYHPDPPPATSYYDNRPQNHIGPRQSEEFSSPTHQGTTCDQRTSKETEAEEDCFEPIKVSVPNQVTREKDTREE